MSPIVEKSPHSFMFSLELKTHSSSIADHFISCFGRLLTARYRLSVKHFEFSTLLHKWTELFILHWPVCLYKMNIVSFLFIPLFLLTRQISGKKSAKLADFSLFSQILLQEDTFGLREFAQLLNGSFYSRSIFYSPCKN